jgi:hypothetical protein
MGGQILPKYLFIFLCTKEKYFGMQQVQIFQYATKTLGFSPFGVAWISRTTKIIAIGEVGTSLAYKIILIDSKSDWNDACNGIKGIKPSICFMS